MLLLGLVVFLWVSSNFLTYAIFSDDTYSKPYFVTYLNTSMFCLYLIPSGVRWYRARRRGGGEVQAGVREALLAAEDREEEGEEGAGRAGKPAVVEGRLNTRETMQLSAEFCLVWFFANYFNSYCLKFTSVPSATILSSTSAMFTLLLGSLLQIERFTPTKLVSVIVSLVGISLIATTDLIPTSNTTTQRSTLEIFLGDFMALLSALAYATYITLLKARVGHESRIDMQQFFGFVGLINVLFLWPGLVLFHYLGGEPFSLPPHGRVWAIVLVNATITLVSDYCWAYAMLLTSPLLVTVGLSLTIPLALLGQMLLMGTVAGVWYWAGAACVFVAFWMLNREQD
ncbi:hypothetical protein BZA05DRAFT_144948 [Tricharina praecox]|uniref:uncharacterized protein n=1 Tax=Tricharina praecox TaxID=43433 RepID=UPI00221FDA76|nr:uncharacterized protein BZA05DRAFT_144948 [Tricharina praecox]KAI5846015.1 hypothetical protein BZA05DRAFT_144948 [Tricharina praecox]